MAVVVENLGVIKLDATSAATAPTDYSGGIVGATLKYKKKVGTHNVINSAWAVATEGAQDWGIEIEVRLENVAATPYAVFAAQALTTGSLTLQAYASPSATTPSMSFIGEVVAEGPDNFFKMKGDGGEAQTAKFSFKGSGALAFAII